MPLVEGPSASLRSRNKTVRTGTFNALSESTLYSNARRLVLRRYDVSFSKCNAQDLSISSRLSACDATVDKSVSHSSIVLARTPRNRAQALASRRCRNRVMLSNGLGIHWE